MKKADITDLQNEVMAIAKVKGFPLKPADKEFLIHRVVSEVKELQDEELSDKIAEEAIDVIIQAVQLIIALGLDPNKIYRQKMDKNWKRKWTKNQEGEFRSV